MNDNKPNLLRISLYQVLDIMFPVVLHYAIMQLTGILLGNVLDAGTLTTLAALIAFPFLWYIYRREHRTGRNASPFTLWIPFVLGILGNAVCSAILNLFRITEQFSNATQEALFQSIPWIQLVGLGLWIPFVEELIFRGLVYGKLRTYYGKGAALWFSALIFALYHGNVIQMLYAFPMGLLLVLVYERWGMLSAPVLLHIGANLIGVLENFFG